MTKSITFDNEILEITETRIECRAKQTVVLIEEVKTFMVDKVKRIVGIRGDTKEPCHMWEDDHYVHVGCLKEAKESFQEKFVQLISYTNQ